MAASGGPSRRSLAGNGKLPVTSKPKAKARKRTGTLQTQARMIVLFILAMLAIAVFKVGLPNGFSRSELKSHPKWKSSSLATGSQSGSLLEASVDITTAALYDKIEFKDIDGGAWKQGWNVAYKGDEWDQEKLKVFVVPHSHNDPGWLRTVEEYYQEKTRRILSTIVESLAKDKRRKFIWEEMSYLERWWQDASETEKKEFKRLVKNGQLEIVGGGWVMNDEANSHFYAIIEQVTEGNLWLEKTVGVTPRNAWAIDPFGHSPTMAYLLRRMGFENMLIQRTHYEVKKALALEKNLEFLWRQSWDSGNTTDILCHMMPFYSYDIPHTCGPEPAICCQFDYWRLPGQGLAQLCPWGHHPQITNEANVRERSLKLLDQYRKKSTLYRSNTLLVPLGDDFRYITTAEAELQFENYQRMFDYINAEKGLKAEVMFGTLEDYFQTLRAEMSDGGGGSFPSLSGDFFTYADREKDYWSGYYVSRPFFKAVDRVLEATLRAADMIYVLSSAYCKGGGERSFPWSFRNELVRARRDLALFQHHDGVTGTAKDHVVNDYASRMHRSILDLQGFMARGVSVLLGKSLTQGVCATAAADLDMFEPAETRASYNALPIRKPIALSGVGEVRRVALFNPTEAAIEEVVTVVTDVAEVCVLDSSLTPIESQVSPEWAHTPGNIAGGRHRLHWRALVPPLGIQTYFVLLHPPSGSSPSCKPAELSILTVFHPMDSFTCPSPYKCSFPKDDSVEIRNRHQMLVFETKHGLMVKSRTDGNGKDTQMEEELAMYQSQGSGAYLFKPIGVAEPFTQEGGLSIATKGSLMEEVYTIPKTDWDVSPVSRSARLYDGKESAQSLVAEMEYHIGLDDHRYNDREVVVRFKTDLDTGRAFFSDLNGFQVVRRETYDKIPLQGNYYPMPSLAFLEEGGGRRFSIHSRQALGVASLQSGWLEVMLDRRLSRDDDRGLGQGVLDNRPTNVVFHLLAETNVTRIQDQPLNHRMPSLLSHRVTARLGYPLNVFLGKEEHLLGVGAGTLGVYFSPLKKDFPCDLHIVSLKAPFTPDPDLKQAFDYSITLQRRGWDTSYCHKGRAQCVTMGGAGSPNLFSLFEHLSVMRAKLTSTNLLHDDSSDMAYLEVLNRKQLGGEGLDRLGLIDLPPMEIQAIKLNLKLSK